MGNCWNVDSSVTSHKDRFLWRERLHEERDQKCRFSESTVRSSYWRRRAELLWEVEGCGEGPREAYSERNGHSWFYQFSKMLCLFLLIWIDFRNPKYRTDFVCSQKSDVLCSYTDCRLSRDYREVYSSREDRIQEGEWDLANPRSERCIETISVCYYVVSRNRCREDQNEFKRWQLYLFILLLWLHSCLRVQDWR